MFYLDPRKEQVHCVHVVVLCLPEGQKFKISVNARVTQERAKQAVDFDRSEYVEDDGDDGKLGKRSIRL